MTEHMPNVLLIVFDTARADAFEPYGAPPGASPAVRQLADRGHAYQGYAAAPWTIPSHAAMFTGMTPAATRVPGCHPDRMIDGSRSALRRLEPWWLPWVFHRAGYETAGVSANGLVSPTTGFDMGFDWFTPIQAAYPCSWQGRLGWTLHALRATADEGAARIEAHLRHWISRADRKPFLWFVNLIECHSPYMPVRAHNPLSAWGRVRASHEWGRHLRGETHRTAFGGSSTPPAAIARMRSLYAGCVRMLDSWLARLLETLDRQGLLDETIVIVTSDHGENFGEAGMLGHSYSLDDRLLRVPMVVAGPAAPIEGRFVSHLDLPAWLADSCSITQRPWPPAAPRGVAVAEFEPYGSRADPQVQAAAASWGIGELGLRRLTERLVCASDGTLKLLRRVAADGAREELYDLAADPLETSPIPVTQDVPTRHRSALRALRAAIDATTRAPAGAAEPAARESNPPESRAPEADDVAALRERMELLGYL